MDQTDLRTNHLQDHVQGFLVSISGSKNNYARQSIPFVRTKIYNKGVNITRKEMSIMAQKSANLYVRIEPDVTLPTSKPLELSSS